MTTLTISASNIFYFYEPLLPYEKVSQKFLSRGKDISNLLRKLLSCNVVANWLNMFKMLSGYNALLKNKGLRKRKINTE